MRATVRALTGEEFEAFELSITAEEVNPYAKLLRQAARLVKERNPMGVTLNGPHWRESSDTYVLTVVLSTDLELDNW